MFSASDDPCPVTAELIRSLPPPVPELLHRLCNAAGCDPQTIIARAWHSTSPGLHNPEALTLWYVVQWEAFGILVERSALDGLRFPVLGSGRREVVARTLGDHPRYRVMLSLQPLLEASSKDQLAATIESGMQDFLAALLESGDPEAVRAGNMLHAFTLLVETGAVATIFPVARDLEGANYTAPRGTVRRALEEYFRVLLTAPATAAARLLPAVFSDMICAVAYVLDDHDAITRLDTEIGDAITGLYSGMVHMRREQWKEARRCLRRARDLRTTSSGPLPFTAVPFNDVVQDTKRNSRALLVEVARREHTSPALVETKLAALPKRHYLSNVVRAVWLIEKRAYAKAIAQAREAQVGRTQCAEAKFIEEYGARAITGRGRHPHISVDWKVLIDRVGLIVRILALLGIHLHV